MGLWAFATASFCLFALSILSYTDFIKQPNIIRFFYFLKKVILQAEKAAPFPHGLYTPQHTEAGYCLYHSTALVKVINNFDVAVSNSHFFSHNLSEPHRGFH